MKNEQRLYNTSKIESIADLVIDTSKYSLTEVSKQILYKLENWNRMCKRCVNISKNPAITFDKNGYCNICSSYMKHFDLKHLKKELEFLKSFKGKGSGKYDVVVYAVNHKSFDAISPMNYLNDKGILIDVKRKFTKKEVESKGFGYWGL